MVLEVCVDTLDSVRACAAAGADRIELCAGLVEGGTTPGLGFLRAARRLFPGKIMAMVRPRAGDFHYSEDEFAMMLDDAGLFRREGADGIVFGMLNADGTIDRDRTRRMVGCAAGMDTTFHRAFDVTPDLSAALETLVELGVRRVLTSGGRPGVFQGADTLAALRRQSAGRISILAGGGVKPELLAEFLHASGIDEVHLSARVSGDSPMTYRRPDMAMGAPTVPGEYERKTASAEIIRSVRAAMDATRA